MDCVSSLEIFWCNTVVLVLCPLVVFTAVWEQIISFRLNPEGLEAQPKLLSTQDTTDALSFCLFSSLWLFLLNLLDLHLYILPSVTVIPYSLTFFFFCTIHPLTLMKGGGPNNCPAHGNFPTQQAVQHKDWTQISWMWQSSRDCSLYAAASSHPTGDLFP